MVIETTWGLLLNLLPALFNIGIACYIYMVLSRNKTTTLFGFLLLAVALWQIQDVLFRTIDTAAEANFVDHFFCVGWIGAGPLVFHFACQYASFGVVRKWYFPLCTYLPFILLQRFYVSDYSVHFVYNEDWGWITAPGVTKVDGLLRIAILILTLAAVAILLRHAYKMRNDQKRKIPAMIIAIGILIPTIGGVIAQIAYPLLFNRQEIPIASILMTFFSGATVVALRKYHLFNIGEYVAVEDVLESLKKIVLVISKDKKVLYMNAHAQELFQWNEDAPVSKPLSDIFCTTADFNHFESAVFEPALTGQFIKDFTTNMQTSDGVQMNVQLYAEPIVRNKSIQYVLIVGNDITSYMQTLEDLRLSKERYDLVEKATNDMVWDWDLTTGKVYRNKEGWRKVFREVLQNEIGTEEEWLSRIHPDDIAKGADLKQRVESGDIGESFSLDVRLIKKDGGIVYLLDRGYVMKDAQGKPIRLIGAVQDVTLRREAEIKLQQELLLKNKEIADAVIIAQENERRLIGAELHDNVNQLLTSATLYLNLARSENEGRETFFNKSEDMISLAIKEVRKLSHSLIPPSWSGETLVEAIKHLLEASENSGLFIVKKDLCGFSEEDVPFKLKLNLYRIVQEQLNNIIKYAHASHVLVQLTQNENSIQLTISDDGVGFDTSKRSKGVGLTNIETRAFLHDGSMKIISAPGQGCTLEISIPLPVAASIS